MDNTEKNNVTIKKVVDYVIPTIWMIIGFIYDMYFHIVHGVEMLDGDMSSEMVLSKLLNDEGRILTDNYYYSTEIRVFHMQWIYRLGLFLFPDNWHIARMFGVASGIILMVVLWLLISKALKLKETGVWIAAFLVFPGGYWYFWQTIYGGFYLPYILFTLASVLSLIKTIQSTKKYQKILWSISMVTLAIMSGTNGVKQMMVCYAPLFVAMFILLLVNRKTVTENNEEIDALKGSIKDFYLHNKRSCQFVMLSFVAVVFNLFGYLINNKLLSKYYFFADYSENSWNYTGFLNMLKEFIHSYGFLENYPLFSSRGIASGMGLCIGFLVLFSTFRLLFKYKKLPFEDQFLYIWSVTEIVMSIIVYSYLNGAAQYFQPIVLFGLFIIGLEIKTEHFEWRQTRMIIWNLVTVFLLIASIGTVKNQLDNPYRAIRTSPNVTKWLVENGYTKGITRFWNASVVTEQSNGMIEMWCRDNNTKHWLQEKAKEDCLPDGRAFVLFYTGGTDVPTDWDIYKYAEKGQGFEVYRDEDYIVYEINGDWLQEWNFME